MPARAAAVCLLLAAVFSVPAASAQDGFAQVRSPCRPPRECFVDEAGTPRDGDRAYVALHDLGPRHPLLAAIEESSFLAFGATWYWLDRKHNAADWDYPSIRARFTREVLRYDNNTFPINYLWHPFSGSAFYAFPRANGLSMPESLAFAMLTSAIWEYGLEFREKVSINDLITTSLSGAALGEFFSKLALYVNRPVGGNSRRQRALGFLLGPSQAIHELRHPRVGSGPPDEYGFMADLHHRFELRAGYASWQAPRDRRDVAELAFEGRFVAIPSYARPGTARRFFRDADVASMRLRAGFDPRPREIEWQADTVLLGYYGQRIVQGPHGVRGASAIVGTGIGFRYRRLLAPTFRDDFGATHLPGLSADLNLYMGRTSLELLLRATPDFVGLTSASLLELIASRPNMQTKTVAHRYGYVYGLGFSGRLELALRVPHLRLGARLFMGRYESAEGLDRDQEELTYDPEATELVRDLEAFVSGSPWTSRKLSLEARVLQQRRESRVEALSVTGQLLRYGLYLTLQL